MVMEWEWGSGSGWRNKWKALESSPASCQLPVADDDWQRGGDRQRLSSECIMVVPPQLDVDVDVGTFPSRGHLDVSLSRPYQRHSDTGYRQAANQAGQAKPGQAWVPASVLVLVLLVVLSFPGNWFSWPPAACGYRRHIDRTLSAHL